jgi:TatA/E family protein of Tat protein translocase
LGPLEIVIIAGLVVLLFGYRKIPGFARSLGIGVGEFKKSFREAAGKPDSLSSSEKKDTDREADGQEQRK